MLFRLLLVIVLASIIVAHPPSHNEPPNCGDMYAPPFAAARDAGSRKCDANLRRNYVPRHKGLGFEILDSESRACFVPDQEYQLLDEIIDSVSAGVKYDANLADSQARIAQALQISKKISTTLTERGFALYIPTDTLSDALINRNLPNERERHIFDCDTGSLIFLTVTENLGAPVSLVDITLPSGSGHNYVRWRIDDQTSLDWDINGQDQCTTPGNLASYEGRSMTRHETLGYALSLRAHIWEQRRNFDSAVADYREASKLYPEAPGSYNNFAWMIATKDFQRRKELQEEALKAANHAVTIARMANYLDTLACVDALLGNFQEAIAYESEALAKGGRNSDFQRRLDMFKNKKDCTGEK
jgi:tetratricopeptide (TPR) repeat protein